MRWRRHWSNVLWVGWLSVRSAADFLKGRFSYGSDSDKEKGRQEEGDGEEGDGEAGDPEEGLAEEGDPFDFDPQEGRSAQGFEEQARLVVGADDDVGDHGGA